MAKTDDFTTALTAAGFDLENPDDRKSLARIVGCQPDDRDALTQRLREVQTLALTEWLAWATARRRFSSLSELDAARVLGLFLEVRQAPPTVELLVEELAIPQGRATSMVGRMKYGRARELTKMSFVEAAREVRQRLGKEKEENKSKTINVSRAVLDRLRDVETDIFLADATTFPNRQTLKAEPLGRLGAIVVTTSAMWGFILDQLDARAAQ
jgi:hypothetical protein